MVIITLGRDTGSFQVRHGWVYVCFYFMLRPAMVALLTEPRLHEWRAIGSERKKSLSTVEGQSACSWLRWVKQ